MTSTLSHSAPFSADPAIPARLAAADAEAIRGAANAAMQPGFILLPEAVEEIVARFSLSGAEELCLHLLPLAEGVARPPISEFTVGAVALCSNGQILLGGNLEWPGSHLGMSLHGEGFVSIRAFQLGLTLAAVAIYEARPCAHCRQCLSEYAAAPDLMLIDPFGHRLRLADLYPWPFVPGDLGMVGAGAETPWALGLPAKANVPEAVAGPLEAALRHAHAPYSKCPAAVALMTDRGVVAGGAIESVAFNPTIQPVMAALVELVAAGAGGDQITGAWLLQAGGNVDYAASTRGLLATLVPEVSLTVLTAVPV